MMGLSPRDMDLLTLPEMAAMMDGFAQFHGGKESDAEEAEFAAMEAAYLRITGAEAIGQA